MKIITRRIPQSHLQTKTAIDVAMATLEAKPPGRPALKEQTADELATWFENYNKQFTAVNDAQAEVNKYTPIKNKSKDKTRQYCSQYMHTIDFQIEQEVMVPGDRVYYGIDVVSGNFLPLNSEGEVKESAGLLITGETRRVAKGGTAIPFPTLVSFQAVNDDYAVKIAAYVNLNKTLELERAKLNDMTEDAIDFIKIMWNEIESTYSSEPIETRREKSRAWGIVYASVNENISIEFTVVDAETGLPIQGVEATLVAAEKSTVTNADGLGQIFTPIEGGDVLKLEAAGYVLVTKPIDTTNGEAQSLNIEMQKTV